MKTLTKTSLFPLLLTAFVLHGCMDQGQVNTDQDDLTIEIASTVAAQALADNHGGLMTSVYDAFSSVSHTGISYTPPNRTMKGVMDEVSTPAGRGSESSFTATYDPATGTHTISFNRSHSGPMMSQSMSAELKYIYRNAEGGFLEFPRRQQDQVAEIDFSSNREGSMSGQGGRSRDFNRVDTLYFSGLLSNQQYMLISGSQRDSGEMSVPTREGILEREWTSSFQLVDVQIDKAVVQSNSSLEDGVTGTINYRITIKHTMGDRNEERDVEGTIELTGDGRALMRIAGIRHLFRINLRDGSVNRNN